MFKFRTWALAGALLVGSVAAHATWYTSEASFLAAINPTFYLENFDSFTFGVPLNGTQSSWAAPGGNGYGWTAGAQSGLWSTPGSLSVASTDDPMTFTFTGAPVRAFGGIVANTNVAGDAQAGQVTMLLSNGESQMVDFSVTPFTGFLGWVGPSAITGATVSATSPAQGNFVQIDHVYTGTAAVPEPMTVTALALGGLALLRRRKKA